MAPQRYYELYWMLAPQSTALVLPKVVLASELLVGSHSACQQGHYKQPNVAHLWDSRTSVEPSTKGDQCETISPFVEYLHKTCQ